MLTLVSFIVVLGVLIFVHEFGHFIFAKLFKVGVEKFSLGFGPKLFGKKIGETEYLISAFPLGGYVKMVGENPEGEVSAEDEARSFATKPPLQRMIIVAAGPVFNLLFAYLIFITLFMSGIPATPAKISEVVEGKPAARAGIRAGDMVTSIDGKSIKHWDELAKMVVESNGKPLEVRVRRDGQELTFRVVPEFQADRNRFGEAVKSPVIGVKSSQEVIIRAIRSDRGRHQGNCLHLERHEPHGCGHSEDHSGSHRQGEYRRADHDCRFSRRVCIGRPDELPGIHGAVEHQPGNSESVADPDPGRRPSFLLSLGNLLPQANPYRGARVSPKDRPLSAPESDGFCLLQ